MITNPIIPIWIMLIISIIFIIITPRKLNSYIMKIILVILLNLINLRIMIPNENVKTQSSNLDILLVVDNSISMQAEDMYNDTRLKSVQKDIKSLMEMLPGSRYSLITFDVTATVKVPFTFDTNIINNSLKLLLPPSKKYALSQSLDLPIDKIREQLNTSLEDPDRKQILFYFSDGESHTTYDASNYRDLNVFIQAGAVLGYGSSEGGIMRDFDITDQNDPYYYFVDKTTNERALSMINEINLNDIANNLSIDYINMNEPSKLKSKSYEIKAGIFKTKDGSNLDVKYFSDTYYFFSIAFIILLMMDYIKYKRSM